MDKPAVFAFMPAYGQTNVTQTTTSLVALALDFSRRDIGLSFATYSYFDIVRIRNLALTFWYDNMPHASHMLCVDADMSFEPIVVRKLLDRGVPLTGVVYPTRSRPTNEGPIRSFVGSFLPEETPDQAGFMKVRGLGGGILLIRRDCIDRLLADQPELVDTRKPSEVLHGDLMKELGLTRVISAFSYLTKQDGDIVREFGEDLSFCERVRDAGMDIWGAVGDPVGHIGLHEWYGCMGAPAPRGIEPVKFGQFNATRAT